MQVETQLPLKNTDNQTVPTKALRQVELAYICDINLPPGVMNFYRKLLLSEVEILQLTPLEHLRVGETQPLQGCSHKNMLHIKIHTAFSQILSSLRCMFQFVWRENAMDKEEGEEKMEDADEEAEGGRKENLIWSSLIRSRPGGLVHSGSLRWMTSLWRKTVWEREEAFFPLLGFSFFPLFSVPFMNHQLLFKCSQSQLGEKVSPKTYSATCVYLKSSQTQGNRTLWVGVCSPSVGMCVCVVGEKVCKVKFPPLLQLCSEGCGGRGDLCLPSSWSLLPPSGTMLPALGSVVGRCVCMSACVCVFTCQICAMIFEAPSPPPFLKWGSGIF